MAVKKPTNPLYFKLFRTKPRKGDLRRFEIVEATLRLLKKDGSSAISIESIAKSMGMLRSHIAYYFPDKALLFREVVELTIAIGHQFLVERMKSLKTPKELLEGYVEATFQWCDEHPEHFYAIFIMWEYSIKNKAFMDLSNQFRKGGKERMQQIIMSGWKDENSKNSIPELAREVHNIVIANILEYFCSDSGMTTQQMAELTKRRIYQLLGDKFV